MRLLIALFLLLAPAAAAAPCVVLLHGLARTEVSLVPMSLMLERAGFAVVNQGYPSTEATIEQLMPHVDAAVSQCGNEPVAFVTHSMGGILLRVWAERHPGRVASAVMLAPPNHGSELVDELGGLAPFDWINGPAGAELGTDGLPSALPPVRFPLGVIAGTRSLNPVYSSMISGPDDGKVSVASTQVDGMSGWVVLPVTHTFMMNDPRVMLQVRSFLLEGRFVTPVSWAAAARQVLAEP